MIEVEALFRCLEQSLSREEEELEEERKQPKRNRLNSEASHGNMKDGPRIFVKSSLFADTVQINHSVSFGLFLDKANAFW